MTRYANRVGTRAFPIAPTIEAMDWQREAVCRGMDSGSFFSPDGESGKPRRMREQAAKAICRSCPVRKECLDWALGKPETYGVWGGTTEEERRNILAGSRPVPSQVSIETARRIAQLAESDRISTV